MVQEVLVPPGLRLLRLVGRCRVLLKDVFPSTGYFLHPRLDDGAEDVDVVVDSDSEVLWEEVGRHHVTIAADDSITQAGNLLCMTVDTSEGSSHSHLSFFGKRKIVTFPRCGS